jgi:CzcA family heavy metal efflux pump
LKNYFTRYKSPIAVILLLIIAGGIFSYNKIQTSLFPEITFPKIKIIADNGEQPVDKMMITVTRPLEEAIKQVPELKTIRSITSRGSCEISAFFNWNANLNTCQQLLESRISEIRNELPASTNITVEQMNPSILPMMGFTLEGKNKTPIELNMIANYIVKPYLSQIDGVSAVRIIGSKTKEYHVVLDEQKMSSLSITPQMISDAVGSSNFIVANGYLSDYRRMYLTLTDAGYYNKEDIENCVVKNDGKRALLLKEIASVEISERTEYTKVNANGKESVLIGILKQPKANLIEVSNEIKTHISDLTKLLPKGVILKPYYVQSDFVQGAIRSVSDSLWIGLLLAIIVVIIFLRSFKASTTVLLTIPVTLGLTLVVLYALGYTFNIMTLGAIAAAIGLIIDDAIVVVEQIHRAHEEFPDEKSTELIRKSVHFLLPSMIGSSISTIVIFIPFLLMSGVAGAYFKVLTNTMIITLICSFFVTWLGLPLIYILFPTLKNRKIKPSKEIRQRKWIAYSVRRPILSLIIIAGLITSAYFISLHIKTGFLPEMDEGSIVLDYTSPPGTSLEETDKILQQVEKIISSTPDVESYSRRTGTQMGFFITEPNTGDYLIQLKAKHKLTTEEVISELRQKIESTQPALQIDFGQVIGDMLGDLMASVQPVEIKIFGDNKVRLHAFAKKAGSLIEKVKGTADIFNGIVIAGPSINVTPDFKKLAQFQITPENLQFQLQTQLEGNVIGSIQEKEQLTEIRMIYPYASRTSLEHVSSQNVFLPGGKLKPLTEIASVSIDSGDAEIERENLQTMVAVTARLEDRDLGSVMKDIQDTINSKIHLPQAQGYHIKYGGEFEEQQKSFNELLLILFLASTLVFILILFLFRDIRASFIILFISVLGVSGSLLALYFTGTPLNVGSYTGLIMIVGIIGENAIFTFQQFVNYLETKTVKEAVIAAVSIRLRPNLMTAFGAIIALMPLALGIGTGAQLHKPLAIAVIGGFIIALPILLVIFPAILYWVYRNMKIIDKD